MIGGSPHNNTIPSSLSSLPPPRAVALASPRLAVALSSQSALPPSLPSHTLCPPNKVNPREPPPVRLPSPSVPRLPATAATTTQGPRFVGEGGGGDDAMGFWEAFLNWLRRYARRSSLLRGALTGEGIDRSIDASGIWVRIR